MESECGKGSEIFVVVCFQKGMGLLGWEHGNGRLGMARRWKCGNFFSWLLSKQNSFWEWELGVWGWMFGDRSMGHFLLVVTVNTKYFLIKLGNFFCLPVSKHIFLIK